MLNKWKYLFVVLVAGVLVIGCSSKETKAEAPEVPVNVATVIKKDVPIFFEAIGNVDSIVTVDVRSQATGILLTAHKAVGDDVKIGELVYTIDPAPYKAALMKAEASLKEAEASLKLAEDRLARYKPLALRDYISELQFDELVTDAQLQSARVDVNKAQVAEAAINLQYCYIRSPINGKLSYNYSDPGNLIVADSSQEMTTIKQMSPIKVNFSVPQRDFILLQAQHGTGPTEFGFVLTDTKGTEVVRKGTVYFIDNSFDLNTGTVLLRGIIDNNDYVLWPGEFGKVKVILRNEKDAILVPEEAIQVGQKGPYVFVVKPDNTVELRNIAVREKLNTNVLVTQGLQEGDVVVTNGQLNLKIGSRVKIVSKRETIVNSNTLQND